jgi:hypothetical protein
MKFMFVLLFSFHRVRHCTAAPAQARSSNFVQYFFLIGTPADLSAKTALPSTRA